MIPLSLSIRIYDRHICNYLIVNSKVTTDATKKMITEGSNTASAEIDRVSTLEMCRIINDEDKTVPLAV